MKTLKSNSKQARRFYAAYTASKDFYLWQTYKTFSAAKYLAYKTCIDICTREEGWALKIISHNSCFFSVAWLTKAGLRVETAQNSYLIEL